LSPKGRGSPKLAKELGIYNYNVQMKKIYNYTDDDFDAEFAEIAKQNHEEGSIY
jgi:hypothetical protein